MEEAGHKMAGEILKRINPKTKTQNPANTSIALIAGAGNNGGDTLVIARALLQKKIKNLSVFLPSGELSPLLKIQEQKLRQLGFECQTYTDLLTTPTPTLIVDGIFGIGLNRKVEGQFLKAIQWINNSEAYVISIDIPSGLNATTGQPMEIAVCADLTLSVNPRKTGFYLRAGVEARGDLVDIPVSFPRELVSKIANEYFLMEAHHAKKWWPRRESSANKSKFGRVYIMAGSKGKWGAAILSIRAAFRAGVGYVVHSSVDESEILLEVPEAMSVSFRKLPNEVRRKPGAVVIGPGTGFSSEVLGVIKRIKKTLPHIPVVLDADALSLLASYPVGRLTPNWVLTPHAAEMSRLTGWSVEKIDGDPIGAAQAAHKKYDCTVILKGLYTVVVSGHSGKAVIVPKGNVALAKAGTGDVLAGLIGGLLAQNLDVLKACLLGVYIHGAAAEKWVMNSSAASMSASDLIDLLPKVMKSLESERV